MADQTVHEKVVFKKYHLSFVEKIRKSGNFNETVLTGLGAGSTFTGTNRTSSSISSNSSSGSFSDSRIIRSFQLFKGFILI